VSFAAPGTGSAHAGIVEAGPLQMARRLRRRLRRDGKSLRQVRFASSQNGVPRTAFVQLFVGHGLQKLQMLFSAALVSGR
jgi:hypothetical protein